MIKKQSKFTYVNVQQTPKPRNEVKLCIVKHCQNMMSLLAVV